MTNEQSTDERSNGASEQFAAGVERIGEAGLQLRMEFPNDKIREDFLIAFRAWLKQYKQTTETAYLVQALVAEKVAAAQDDDTTGNIWGVLAGYVYANVIAGKTAYNYMTKYSDWMPW